MLTDPPDDFLISEIVLRYFNGKAKTFPWKYSSVTAFLLVINI
jgi:hypothetical protein